MEREEPKKTLTNEQLRIERTRYNILVQQDVLSLDFNENIHKKVQSFIYVNIILAAIFTWCSSSNTSNIYLFLNSFGPKNKALIIFNSIITLILIMMISLIFATKNIIKKHKVKPLLNKHIQSEIFKTFIKERIKKK